MPDNSSPLASYDRLRALLNVISEVATAAQFTEFRRLLAALERDAPYALCSGEDIRDLFATALFNLGDITQDEIEQVYREISRDGEAPG